MICDNEFKLSGFGFTVSERNTF